MSARCEAVLRARSSRYAYASDGRCARQGKGRLGVVGRAVNGCRGLHDRARTTVRSRVLHGARFTSVHDCPVPLGASAHCTRARNESGVQVVEVHEH